MTHAVRRDELEAQFSGRVTLVAALLEDLAKCVPAAVTLAEDATLEDAFELHDSNARSVRQIFLDSTEALEDSDALRKEMKAFSETLDQGSLATFQKWFDLINKATRWDASLRTVRKQRREHNTIMAASQAAAAKAKRELDLAVPVPPPPPPVVTHPIRSEARLAPIEIPPFHGDDSEFISYWNQFETVIDKNPGLSAVQKFMALRNSLKGEAYRKVQHLMITEDDYETAKNAIKRWYGD